MPNRKTPLFVLAGPTASGKSDVGVVIAERIGAEIISADSVQLYRHFDIGSAKPSADLRRRVRHHLVDVAEPDEEFNVARYRAEAAAVARRLWAGGVAPMVVGGSGLYIKGLVEGLDCAVKTSPGAEARLDALYETEGQPGVYERMRAADPAWAARVHPHDTFRTRRALGVFFTSGKTMSALFGARPGVSEFDALTVVLDPPRETLYKKIEARTEAMLAAGWLAEVNRLREMGYNDTIKPMRSIGYRVVYNLSLGRIDADRARREIVKETKAFARRQLTWLRKVDNAIFVRTEGDETTGRIADTILERDDVTQFLARHHIGR